MGFLAPLMLWGSLAAGIPIALHFFYRSRYRKVPWAAMAFLRTSIEQTSRRLKFQELLLLVLRTALLALLAFALARPTTEANAGVAGEPVDAVFLIDVSMSMTAREAAETRLEQARHAALAVLDHLPPRSTVQIVSVADRANLLGPRVPGNLEQARQVLQAIQPTGLGSDLLPGVTLAAEILHRGPSAGKEVYLFSDLQKLGWDRQASALVAAWQELSRQGSVYLVRCGTRMPRNAAILGIVPPAGVPHTGERLPMTVLVRNTGTDPVRDLTVTLNVDGAKAPDSQLVPLLSPGETRAVSLSVRLDRPGLRLLTAALKQDDLDGDNQWYQVMEVREQVRILVVDGTPNDREPEKAAAYFLLHALQPVAEAQWGRYHLQPRVVGPSQAIPGRLGDKDVCVLVNAGLGQGREGGLAADFVERLAGWVKEGHGLLIFGGNRVEPKTYNAALREGQDLLPVRLAGLSLGAGRLDPKSVPPLSFLAPFRAEPMDLIGQTEVTRRLFLAEPAEGDAAQVLMRFGDGKPAVVSRKVGDGEVVLVALTADPSWGDFPLRPTFLPFVHAAVAHLVERQAGMHNKTAGQPLEWAVPANTTGPWAVLHPDGRKLPAGPPEVREGRPFLQVRDTARPGFYRIIPDRANVAEGEGMPFAVTPEVRETADLASLTDEQLDERLGFKPIHLTAGSDPGGFQGSERFAREWTPWLLLVLLGMVLAETGLAWWCGRGW